MFEYSGSIPFASRLGARLTLTVDEKPTWVQIPAGRFSMGSYDFYPEEAPVHECRVDSFQLTRDPVTNAQFARFVRATGYVTVAERGLSEFQFPHLDPLQRQPGSLVFTETSGPVDLRDWTAWWRWARGAQWRHPLGEDSGLAGRESHPVVQVAYDDAVAYADWIGARLPSEAELEYAAGAGRTPDPYAWGPELELDGRLMANTWRGRFPYLNKGCNGWVGTSPVGVFPVNAFGLNDVIGNVWEWTSDLYTSSHAVAAAGESCGAGPGDDGAACRCSPKAVPTRESPAPRAIVQRVLKGGSHLCAPEYCLRYRPAARSPQYEDTATSHIGFRCAR